MADRWKRRTYSDEEIDRIIRRALREYVERIPVPDPEKGWRDAYRRFLAARRRRMIRRWAGAGAAAALLLLAATSPIGYSWNPWQLVRGYFIGEQGTGLVQMGRQARSDQAAPPPGPGPEFRATSPEALSATPQEEAGVASLPAAGSPLEEAPTVQVIEPPPPEEVSLEEAAARAPFQVRFPAWLPEDTGVVRVIYRPGTVSGSVAEVEIQLGGPLGKDLYLSQTGPIEQFGSGSGFDPETTRASEVEIDGTQAVLLEFLKNDSSSLEWFAGGVHYRISSDWEGETTLRMARSLAAVEAGAAD